MLGSTEQTSGGKSILEKVKEILGRDKDESSW